MQYMKECLQLLYWIYFKPYTLKQYVQSICPEITDPYFDNIYRRSAEAKANPRLKRYDDQTWWLTTLVPVVAVFLFVPLMEGISQLITGANVLQFNWLLSSVFMTSCLFGKVFAPTIGRRLFRNKFFTPSIATMTMILLFAVGFLARPFFSDLLASDRVISIVVGVGIGTGLIAGEKVAFDAVFYVTFGLAGGMAIGIAALGVAFCAAGIWALGTAFSVTLFGLTFSWRFIVAVIAMAFGVAVIGAAFGLVFGDIVFSMVLGSTVGSSFLFGMLRFYFWLPELLYMLFLKFWPHPAAAKLPLLPPQFDQLIILPLPFMPSLIAQAYHESPTAARSTINYLITSTNQQKAASKAMLIIAAEEFRRCRTAGDLAAVRGQLNWLPADLTGKISLCLDLSQDTAAALDASTPYRQEERLRKVCAKIDQQRNALSAASAREATTLGAVLDQWQGILSTACATLHETAQRSGEIPQVYLPGPPLEPDKAGSLFKGRRDLFRQIESLLLSAQPPTLVMHGNRRSGKSSALLHLPKQMPSDILPLFVDCQGAAVSSTLPGFARHLAEQLLASAKATCRLTLPPPDKNELASDPFATLLAWLDAVEQAAPGKTFLLCLDEFERIDEIVTAAGSRAPLNFLRHLIQHRRNWLLLFAGAHTPDELAPHWSDCLINTRSLRVSCLDKDDAVELICRPVPDFPKIWPDVAVEEVWQLTQGQPFLIQLLCQEAVEHLNRRKAKTVQPGDVAAILPAAFEHGHYYFDEFWRALGEDQRTLLATLAKGEAVPPELNPAAAVLLRKEVLVQENGGYAFKVPLIGEWINTKNEEKQL